MSWVAIILAILQLLLPYLQEWFKDDAKAVEKLLQGTPGDSASENISEVFDTIRAQIWWFEFGKRAKLAIYRRVALRHAEDVQAAAILGTPQPKLTARDHDELSEID